MDLYLDPLFYSIDLFVCFCARANLVLLLSFCSIIYTGPGDSFNSVLFVQNIVLGVSKVHSIWILRCVFFLFFYFYFFNLIFLLFLFFLFLWRIESMFFYLDCIEVVDCVQSFPWQVRETDFPAGLPFYVTWPFSHAASNSYLCSVYLEVECWYTSGTMFSNLGHLMFWETPFFNMVIFPPRSE